MNSAALAPLGFGAWHPLNLPAEKTLLAALPFLPGVYAVRCLNSQSFSGPSDLVYFGKATNLKGLNQRIRQYFHPGYRNATSLRIRAAISNCSDFELSWVEQPVDKAKELESWLIARYEEVHGMLPPWNKRH